MQLTYRGQVYSTFKEQVQTTSSESTARFLGQTYIPCCPTQPFKSRLGVRKYHGIAYSA